MDEDESSDSEPINPELQKFFDFLDEATKSLKEWADYFNNLSLEKCISFPLSGTRLRVADSLETSGLDCWLSASGTVLAQPSLTVSDALTNIRQKYYSLLIDFPTLRIKMKDNLYWCYATDQEIQFDNLITIVNDAPLLDGVPNSYDPNAGPLWRVQLSQINDKIKLKVIASQAIIDGRTIFDLFELFSSIAFKKNTNNKLKNYNNQPVLYKFGKKDWFAEELSKNKFVISNNAINSFKINPHASTPSHIINTQWEVDYLPIKKFCQKHNTSPQAILMAIQNEAIRICNQGIIDDIDTIPIASYIPVDNRSIPYTTELLKNSLFFSHVGVVFPLVLPEKDILKNIKTCSKKFKQLLFTTQSCDFAYTSANLRDYETHELTYPQNFPNPTTYLFASHIGLVGVGYEDVQFRFSSPLFKEMYWPSLFGFHNEKTFAFMLYIPNNCPESFLEGVKNTSLKYYDYILNDTKE